MKPLSVLCIAVAVLIFVLVLFDSHLLAERCETRVVALTADKDRAAKHIKELQQALDQSADTLEQLHRRPSPESLQRQLDALGDNMRTHRRAAHGPGEDREVATGAARKSLPPLRLEHPPADVPSPVITTSSKRGESRLKPKHIAVVVIAYNRPQYLDRALRSIFAHHPGEGYPVYVSQDGENAGVADIIAKHGARRMIHPRKILKFKAGTYVSKFPGYSYLAIHYGWALGALFDEDARFEGVIILEEDIEVAPDFFNYFTATAPLLYQDESLLCVSAFNDNGQDRFASDPKALYRSDFFPGLGWLMTRKLWGELGPKWPGEAGFWDDWLREPPQRKGRASIRPEVSRTYTFGEKGTSQGQFSKFLREIKLGSGASFDPTSDTSYLHARKSHAIGTSACSRLSDHHRFRLLLCGACPSDVPNQALWHDTQDQVSIRRCIGADSCGRGAPTFRQCPLCTSSSRGRARNIAARVSLDQLLLSQGTGSSGDALLMYKDAKEYVNSCKRIGVMEDLKAGVPRTGYQGIVILRIGGRRVFIAPSYPLIDPVNGKIVKDGTKL